MISYIQLRINTSNVSTLLLALLSYLGKRSAPRENARARGEGRFPLRLAGSPARLCVIARLVSLAQIGELACKLLLA